jgi:hypothetical protein
MGLLMLILHGGKLTQRYNSKCLFFLFFEMIWCYFVILIVGMSALGLPLFALHCIHWSIQKLGPKVYCTNFFFVDCVYNARCLLCISSVIYMLVFLTTMLVQSSSYL